jgi:hypothetical protein
MARLDERSEQFIQEFAQQMAQAYGDALQAVILYGSGAGSHFVPGHSNLNLLVVLSEIRPADLREVTARLRRLRRERLEPIFLTSSQLRTLPDTYPIEVLEMKEQHRVLHGEDLLASVHVAREKLWPQLMSELAGKSLRLRSLYVAAGGDARRLEPVFSPLVTSLGVLMRTLLRWSDEGFPPPLEYLEIVTQLEERLGLDLPGLRDAYQVKLGMRRLMREELDALFLQLMRDVDLLVQCTARLLPEAP